MKKDYGKAADTLIAALGGKGNITRVFHCMTRLRFYVKDRSRIDEDAIKKMAEVSGVNWHQEQFQVIAGNEVNEMYRALEEKGIPTDEGSFMDEGIPTHGGTHMDKGNQGQGKAKGGFNKVIDTITGCMTPMIPALTAAGMIKVVLTLISYFHVLEDTSSTYQVLNFIGDVAFYFMPVLIAANAAKVFRVNQALALIIAGVFLHPNFVAMVAGDGPVTFIGLPVTKVSYSYSVIPVILMVWIMSYIEKLVDRITPRITKLILNPTLIILISAPIALIVIGPLGAIIGNGLAVAIDFLSAKLGFIIVGILAAAFPFIVMTGMHHALTPIGLNAIATAGVDKLIFVSQVCSNLAQSGAALAVAVKTRDKDMKQLASAAGVSAMMGITEPALYGVTLKLKRPVVAAAIGAGIGGIVGGILQVSLYISQNCIMAIPAFIGGEGMTNLLYGIIMIVVSFAVSFILTIIFGFEDETVEKTGEYLAENSAVQKGTMNSTMQEEMTQAGKDRQGNPVGVRPLVKKIEAAAPVKGKIVELSHVKDSTFAEKVLGDGIAVYPAEGKVFAPADGVIATVTDTGHGIMMRTHSGAELLIHIGLETVNLNGRGFTVHVKDGQQVKRGELLVEFDLDTMIRDGYDMVTPMVVTNGDDFIRVVPMKKKNEEVDQDDILLTIV
ncbi:beta-glucoside-specific PTS transporter subunit IIABC [Blautia schinkii]|nr:beta-glucoside-specific PTS transporter subunit IIABC [Blautia schinkii]